MRSLLEKAIIHLLNGDTDRAESLFHKFMVERAREIHESLRQSDDVKLAEGWDTEIQEEEYFDDLGDEEPDDMGGGSPLSDIDGEAPMGDVAGDVGADVGDDMGGDMGDGMGDDMEGDLEGDLAGDEVGGHEDIESKLDSIEATMDELSAEFDRLMAKLDIGGEELGDELGDVEGELGGIEGEEDLGGEDDLGGDEFGGGEATDLADQMEDDLSDEDQPEHEMAEDFDPASEEVDEDDEMMEDITESVLAELDKVAVPAMTGEGKEVGSGGKTMSPNTGDSLPHHPASDRVNQAKPFLVKATGDAHNDSFERETPPSSKEVKRRRNNDAGVKKLEKVPDKGDKSAKLNSDFASRPSTQSITAGKKST